MTIDYYIFGSCEGENYSECFVNFQSQDYQSKWDYELNKKVVIKCEMVNYPLTVTYEAPIERNDLKKSYLNKFKEISMDEPNKWYISSDLSLINYFLTSTKSELWNPGASSRAIKFINELNVLTEGTNISYYLDVRAGNQDKDMMYESAFGPVTVFYNGYAYGTRETGIYLQHVIYIPKSTKDTKEAYIEAAQKRINDYLGKDNGVLVTYGGLISSLPEFAEDIDNPINSDGNYYNISILGKTYKFYIVKFDDSKLVVPKYNAKNLENNIIIKSNDSSIPLDTDISTKIVDNLKLKEKLGTDNYISYDINLYSTAKNAKIEKLKNGLFEVSIPVPTKLEGKTLAIYYENSAGKLEEYEVVVNNGMATFKTNHFSVYTLSEKLEVKENNPKTGDQIMTWLSLGIISLIGLTGTLVYRKRYNK